MEFQVWREAQLLTYNLVGNNIFSTASPSNGMLRLGVPVDQQITVMPGDFVGVRTIQGNEDDPIQILTIRGYYINYNLTKRGFDSTPAQLPLGISLGLNCFTPSNSLPTNISITPLINAVLNSEFMAVARFQSDRQQTLKVFSILTKNFVRRQGNPKCTNIIIHDLQVFKPY